MAKPRNKPLVLPFQVTGSRATLKAFRQLPKDAADELRAASMELASEMAGWIAEAAAGDTAQSALMIGTIKVRRDRIPVVEVGGDAPVGRHGSPAYAILFGAEFGASQYPQFRPHRGKQGYFIFPTVEANAAAIGARWMDAADAIIAKWSATSEGGE